MTDKNPARTRLALLINNVDVKYAWQSISTYGQFYGPTFIQVLIAFSDPQESHQPPPSSFLPHHTLRHTLSSLTNTL